MNCQKGPVCLSAHSLSSAQSSPTSPPSSLFPFKEKVTRTIASTLWRAWTQCNWLIVPKTAPEVENTSSKMQKSHWQQEEWRWPQRGRQGPNHWALPPKLGSLGFTCTCCEAIKGPQQESHQVRPPFLDAALLVILYRTTVYATKVHWHVAVSRELLPNQLVTNTRWRVYKMFFIIRLDPRQTLHCQHSHTLVWEMGRRQLLYRKLQWEDYHLVILTFKSQKQHLLTPRPWTSDVSILSWMVYKMRTISVYLTGLLRG